MSWLIGATDNNLNEACGEQYVKLSSPVWNKNAYSFLDSPANNSTSMSTIESDSIRTDAQPLITLDGFGGWKKRLKPSQLQIAIVPSS